MAFQHHVAEDSNLSCFVFLLQAEVGLIPISPDPPALEAFHLAVYLLSGIGSSLLAQLDWSQCLALLLIHRLENFEFDGQAMAVPSRHKPNAASLQDLVLIHHVFEHLVERMAHVQGAIGVGRPVVEGEGRSFVG